MSKTTWRDVKKGDVVEINGRHWHVSKIKPKGKRARVTMDAAKLGERTGNVLLADRVKISTTKLPGSSFRASPEIVRRVVEKRAAETWTPPGDMPSVPPELAQRNVEKILGARLIGESTDGGKTYYVPPVDVSTIAMHLRVFHGVDLTADGPSEGHLLETHAKAHELAERGDLFLHVEHTHRAAKS